MGLGFYGLLHLPLPEAIALGYAMPLVAVIFAAVFLGETVRDPTAGVRYFFGMMGVAIIILAEARPFSGGRHGGRAGGRCNQGAAGGRARRHGDDSGAAAGGGREDGDDRSLFSIIATAFSLVTVPFGWRSFDLDRGNCFLVAAGFCGGVAQILLTESYRHADVSTVAPFEYSSIVIGRHRRLLCVWRCPGGSTLVGTAMSWQPGYLHHLPRAPT